jgi:DNA-binding transcriptional MerR regulator
VIRIGDFARLGRVSVVALRHYDDIGLLRPAAVDDATGYRYYAAGQLARLHRILALKDLGFSLKQIEAVLDGLTLEQLAGMLKLREIQAERVVVTEHARLRRIRARLRQIQLEDSVPDYAVVLKEAPAQLVASRRVTVPTNDQVARILGQAFDDAYGLVNQRGAKEAGPCLAIWHQAANVYRDEDVEAVVPIERAVAPNDTVEVYELPGTPVVSVIHEGDFGGFAQAHSAALAWMEANGYRATGGYREVYLQHDPAAPAASVTEIQYPVERSAYRQAPANRP